MELTCSENFPVTGNPVLSCGGFQHSMSDGCVGYAVLATYHHSHYKQVVHIYYVGDIIRKTYSLNGLLEDLLLQTPLKTVSLYLGRLPRIMAATQPELPDSLRVHTRSLSFPLQEISIFDFRIP